MNIREDFHEDNFEDEEPVEHYQMLGMVKIRNFLYLYNFIIDSKFENRIFHFNKNVTNFISFEGFAFGDMQEEGESEDENDEDEDEEAEEQIEIEGSLPTDPPETVNCQNFQNRFQL